MRVCNVVPVELALYFSSADCRLTRKIYTTTSSDHVPEEVVDLVLPASKVSPLDEVVGLLPPAAGRRVQLEGPQEVRGVLEVGSHGHDLVHQVLHADDAVLA